MGEENRIEDLGQEGYRSLGKVTVLAFYRGAPDTSVLLFLSL